MQLVCLLFVALFASANAFNRIVPVRRLALRANKIDGISIEGALTPISNNVLIKVKEAASSTSGGLYIPDNAKERPTEGTVVAAGPGRVHPETAKQLALAVQVGHSVMYGKYDGTELKYNDINHQMIKDDDVLLTYTGPTATLESVQCVKDQVLVRLPPKEETNLSGIIVATPGSTEKRPNHGVVAKVGPGRQAGNGEVMKPQVQPGDGVRFREYGGSQIKLDGQEYIVVRAYDILAKW